MTVEYLGFQEMSICSLPKAIVNNGKSAVSKSFEKCWLSAILQGHDKQTSQ